MSLVDLVLERARRSPTSVAVRAGDRSVTYEELDRRSAGLARRLRAEGVRLDTPVGLAMARSPELVVAVYGVLRSGGACLPLDLTYPEPRLRFMLEDAGARLVIVDEVAPSWVATLGVEPMRLGSADDTEFEAGGGDEGIADDHLAYVIYTSGSTGQPKGVAMEHGPLRRLVEWQIADDGELAGGITVQFAPISFDISFQEILSTHAVGGTLVVVDEPVRRDPVALHRFVREQRVTRLFLPTAALHPLADACGGAPCPDLRRVYVAGEQLRTTPAIRKWFAAMPACRLDNHYGPTEAHVVTHATLAADPADWPVLPPIGSPLPHVGLRILDSAGREVPRGEVGEITLGGACLARGYLGRPDLTAERFAVDATTGERRYRTGDLGRVGDDGEVECLGRVDEQVKVDGYRIELGEVEAVLVQHPDVAEAVATVRREEVGGHRLVAYVVRRRGAPAAVNDDGIAATRELDPELVALARAQLPAYMVPTVWVGLDRVPITPSGKVDRDALPEPPRDRPPTASPFVAPRTPTERLLAAEWTRSLAVSPVGIDDNVFDLGATSLLVATMTRRIADATGRELTVVAVMEHPTVRSLARCLDDGAGATRQRSTEVRRWQRRRGARLGDERIAVVGLACRFPEADTPAAYWDNLVAGRESITVSGSVRRGDHRGRGASGYVGAAGLLAGVETFDAALFGYSPREAQLLDPQHRLFLECALEALEDAACLPNALGHAVGVFGGGGPSTYLLNNLHGVAGRPGRNLIDSMEELQVLLANDKDFVTSRVSYTLDLRGPSVNVNAACATSLVAVHQACRALLAGECVVALAGAVNVPTPQLEGYVHQPDMVFSPDGHCRAYDEAAAGTVFGSGAGVVVLQPLSDALADGRDVYAVILGTAVTNDGSMKAGMAAPSVDGQARAIAEALEAGGVAPDTITYLEGHGTGTPLGDPIEVEALRRVFGAGPSKTCALGSAKTNVGHLGWASGLAGLVKTILALRHGAIPPTLHFRAPNPALRLDDSPFSIASRLTPWSRNGQPRRAGVSAFGLGGVNAHVVLEEAGPAAARAPAAPVGWMAVPVSARTTTALGLLEHRLGEHLESASGLQLADVARTLSVGRRHREVRRAYVVSSLDELVAAFTADGPRPPGGPLAPGRSVGLFTGQGAEHPAMMRTLYETAAPFRAALHAFDDVFREELGATPAELLASEAGSWTMAEIQPLVYATQMALVAQWRAWGIDFDIVAGHSLGEFAAAATAGVFSPHDGAQLVAARGRLLATLPDDGGMAAVFADVDTIHELLANEDTDGVTIAATNGPSNTTVSGPRDAVRRAVAAFGTAGLEARVLNVPRAGHSALMDPVLDDFEAAAGEITLHRPSRDLISNVTGQVAGDEVTTAGYWRQQLREPVRFGEGLVTIVRAGGGAFVEIGANPVLIPLAQAALPRHQGPWVASLRRGHDDLRSMVAGLATLYEAGVDPDWEAVHGRSARLLHLPTYPFERERHWVAAPGEAEGGGDTDGLLHTVAWEAVPGPMGGARPDPPGGRRPWCIVVDDASRESGRLLAAELGRRRVSCIVTEDAWSAVPTHPAEFVCLSGVSAASGPGPSDIHDGPRDILTALESRLDPSRHFVHAMLQLPDEDPPGLWLITRGAQGVEDHDVPDPVAAAVWGFARTVRLEHPRLGCRVLDLPDGAGGPDLDTDARHIADLVSAGTDEPELAVRSGRWFAPRLRPRRVPPAPARLDPAGTYLVVGGLTGLGLWSAERLAGLGARRLVLAGRRPPGAEAARAIAALRDDGVDVVVTSLDVTDAAAVGDLVARCHTDEHPLRGLIHSAGVVDDALVERLDWAGLARVLAPKAQGAWNLHASLEARGIEPDLFVTYSSAAAVLGNLGQASHAAANAFLDALAGRRRARNRAGLSIAWGAWADVGYLAGHQDIRTQLEGRGMGSIDAAAGRGVVDRHLGTHEAQIAVLPNDWSTYLERHGLRDAPFFAHLAEGEPARSQSSTSVGERLTGARGIERRALLKHHLVALLGELVGAPPATTGDDTTFTELGVDSLSAIQLRNRLEQDLDVDLSARICFEVPSVGALADHLADIVPEASRQATEVRQPAVATVTDLDIEPVPLTIQQQRWLRLVIDARYGHRVVPVIVHAPLDRPRFIAALREVVGRHDLLRHRYRDGSAQLLPIDDVVPDEAELFGDLTALDDAGRRAALADEVRRCREQLPDPRHRPPWTVRCLALGAGRFAVVLGLQHLEFDGSSLSTFVEELRTAYRAKHDGVPHDLATPVQYAEYASHQRAYSANDIDADRAFFEGLYAAVPATTALPDHPGFQRTRALPSRRYTPPRNLAAWDDVVASARALGASPFSVLLASYAQLVAQLTDRPDAVIGMIKSARSDARFRGTIGPFTMPFPVPIRVAGRSPANLVQHCDRVVGAVMSRPQYPSPDLSRVAQAFAGFPIDSYFTDTCVNFLAYQREQPTGTPRVEVLEVLGPVDHPDFKGADFSELRRVPGLHLIAEVVHDALRASYWYHTDRFTEPMVAAWAAQHRAAMDNILDQVRTEVALAEPVP